MANLFGESMKDYRSQSVNAAEKIANSTGVYMRGAVSGAQGLTRAIKIHPQSVNARRLLSVFIVKKR